MIRSASRMTSTVSVMPSSSTSFPSPTPSPLKKPLRDCKPRWRRWQAKISEPDERSAILPETMLQPQGELVESIKVQTHVGADGLLTLQVPVGVSNTDVEVVLVVQPVATSEHDDGTNSLGWPAGFFEETAGQWAEHPLCAPSRESMKSGTLCYEISARHQCLCQLFKCDPRTGGVEAQGYERRQMYSSVRLSKWNSTTEPNGARDVPTTWRY